MHACGVCCTLKKHALHSQMHACGVCCTLKKHVLLCAALTNACMWCVLLHSEKAHMCCCALHSQMHGCGVCCTLKRHVLLCSWKLLFQDREALRTHKKPILFLSHPHCIYQAAVGFLLASSTAAREEGVPKVCSAVLCFTLHHSSTVSPRQHCQPLGSEQPHHCLNASI